MMHAFVLVGNCYAVYYQQVVPVRMLPSLCMSSDDRDKTRDLNTDVGLEAALRFVVKESHAIVHVPTS